MIVTSPRRRNHSYTQSLGAPPEAVFPLLCPVREADWTPDWHPSLVLSKSGVAEQDCVFVTPATPGSSIWVITRFDPVAKDLQFIKVTPEHSVCKIEITLTPAGAGRTSAYIVYTYTSLGPVGDAFLDEFTEEWYREFMQEWERALNHYLATGRMLGA